MQTSQARSHDIIACKLVPATTTKDAVVVVFTAAAAVVVVVVVVVVVDVKNGPRSAFGVCY